MKTYYRVKATGQWCEPCYENGGADPDAIAATLGLAAGTVEAIEAEDGDPRTGDLLRDPNVAVAEPAPPPAPTPLAQLTDALLADPNIAPETKAAIQQISGGDVKGAEVPLTPRVK